MRSLAVSFACLCLVVVALAQDVTLERLVRSRYVIVGVPAARGEVDYGDSLAANRDDRDARQAVEKSLRDWKRYTVTLHPQQAELLFLVRRARNGSVYVRTGPPVTSRGKVTIGRVPSGTDTSAGDSGREIAVGTEVQNPNVDLLEVYALEDGKPGMLLWRGARKNGLEGPNPPLFEEYKKNAEKLAKKLGLP